VSKTRKTGEPGLLLKLTVDEVVLEAAERKDADGKEEKSEHQAFVTNPGWQSESIVFRKSKEPSLRLAETLLSDGWATARDLTPISVRFGV
jgi:hypothetical protein